MCLVAEKVLLLSGTVYLPYHLTQWMRMYAEMSVPCIYCSELISYVTKTRNAVKSLMLVCLVAFPTNSVEHFKAKSSIHFFVVDMLEKDLGGQSGLF